MDIDVLINRLEEIGTAMEPVVDHLGQLDNTYRELRKVIKILAADDDFVKLDKLGVLSDDDDPQVDGGKPFAAMLQSLSKEKEMNPINMISELYSRVYGVILALDEYKKYVK